ncbi:MAG: hypothetical protein AAGA93_13290 [Actinomycetota bacterium]
MTTEGLDDDEDRTGPRTWYLGSDRDVPWSGDDDFVTWQRRQKSVNRWDVLSLAVLLVSVPAGWGLFRLTGTPAIAIAGFVACLVVSTAFTIRKRWWAAAGS